MAGMLQAHASSIVETLLGLQLGAAGQGGGNRVALEGLSIAAGADGALRIDIARLEATALRLVHGAFTLEIGSLALHKIAAQVGLRDGAPRLLSLEAADAELSAVKVHGPLSLAAPEGRWSLAPIATAEGTIRAEIVDAHLLFDADVTVPIRRGTIDFKDTTVEHVGPDSRMGVSKLGLYVDAPNGRSYLYQFSSTPLAGVEYEKRGAMLGPWATHRGSLRLQEFGESLLRQGPPGHGVGFTEQSRLLFERTAVSGELRLGDGVFAAPGLQAELVERATGRNTIRLQSGAVGRGLTVDMPLLAVRQASFSVARLQFACEQVTGALTLQVSEEGRQLRFALSLPSLRMSGLRVQPLPGDGP